MKLGKRQGNRVDLDVSESRIAGRNIRRRLSDPGVSSGSTLFPRESSRSLAQPPPPPPSIASLAEAAAVNLASCYSASGTHMESCMPALPSIPSRLPQPGLYSHGQVGLPGVSRRDESMRLTNSSYAAMAAAVAAQRISPKMQASSHSSTFYSPPQGRCLSTSLTTPKPIVSRQLPQHLHNALLRFFPLSPRVENDKMNAYLREASSWEVIFKRCITILKRQGIRQKTMAVDVGLSGSTLSPLLKNKYKHTKQTHVDILRLWCWKMDRLFLASVAHAALERGMNMSELLVSF